MDQSKSSCEIRFSEEEDQKYLVEWLLQPGVLQWFPLANLREVEDAARIWVSYSKYQAVLTALWEGVPCGICNLYLQPYKKLAHECLLAIIVDERHRNKGIGSRLLTEMFALAKERFHIQILYLEVYEGNPAIRLYERMGFTQYGVHRRFIKEGDLYLNKNLMLKRL